MTAGATTPSFRDPIERLRTACAGIRESTEGRARQGLRHDDVDDSVGTFHTDDALGFDPFPMLELMQESGADYAVFGQVAGIMHGSNEPTGDLDILWDPGRSNVPRMVQVFGSARGLTFRADHHGSIADLPSALVLPKLYFEGFGCAGDLCTPMLSWGGLDVLGILHRKVWAFRGSLAVPYVDVPDLIEMRIAIGGTKHDRRARELQRLRGSITEPFPGSIK